MPYLLERELKLLVKLVLSKPVSPRIGLGGVKRPFSIRLGVW